MTNMEMIIRIQELFDCQYEGNDLYLHLTKLQDDLFGDPTGRERKAFCHDRTAAYWENSGRPEAPELGPYWRKEAAKVRAGEN